MKMKLFLARVLKRTVFVFPALLVPLQSQGMIIAGAKGGANNTLNTTREELNDLTTLSDGSYFDNVFQFGGGAAVYIGFANTVDGPRGYALTGMHLGNQSTFNIQSDTYTTVDRISIEGSDLALIRFSHANNNMPSLQAINLTASTPNHTDPVVMIGRGRNRAQNATTDANTSDAISVNGNEGYTTTSTRLKRWGTNNVSNFGNQPGGGPGGTPIILNTFNIGGRETDVFRTVFDQPSSGEWLTTNQAQGVAGDSGGGVFSFDGTLMGIMVAVQTLDGSNNNALFGNTTLIADIGTYRNSIDAETGGILIPEPGTIFLALIAFFLAGFSYWNRG